MREIRRAYSGVIGVVAACAGFVGCQSGREGGGEGSRPNPASGGPATYEFSENFEALAVGATPEDYVLRVLGYTAGGGTVTVSADTAFEGTKSLKLTAADTTPAWDRGVAQFCTPTGSPTRFTARFNIRFENFASWAGLTVGPGDGYPRMAGGDVYWWTRFNGTLFLGPTIFTWEARRWYEVEIDVNVPDDRATISVDGRVLESRSISIGWKFDDPDRWGTSGIGGPQRCLMIGTAWDATQTIYVDNVRLSAANPCSTLPREAECADDRVYVKPHVTCIADRGGGRFTAVFGYVNQPSTNAHISVESGRNAVSPGPADRGQPTWFKGATAGENVHPAAFAADFYPPATMTWSLADRRAVATADITQFRQCVLNERGDEGTSLILDGREYPLTIDGERVSANGVLPTEQPEPGQAAGTSRAALNVTDDGAATTSVPIEVPAGRRGIQPALALAYHSQRGNGLAGVGWSLSGLSEIRVCPTSLAADGEHRPPRFDGSDPLCLDGERLVEVNGFNAGNAVLRAGPGEKEYRTQRTDGTRIIGRGYVDGVPTSFEAATRDGRIITFGIHTGYDDRHDRQRRLGRPLRTVTVAGRISRGAVLAAWPVTQVRDRFHNRMDVLHQVEISGPESEIYEDRPKEILYTGFRAELGLRSVQLTYGPRAPLDRMDAWFGGTNRRLSQVLIRIETYAPVHDASTAAGGARAIRLVRQYRLAHRTSAATGRSLLESLTECEGFSGACLRPVTFTYEAGDPGFDVIDTKITDAFQRDAEYDHGSLATADLDGDGQGDIIYAVKDAAGMRKHRYWLSNAGGVSGPGLGQFVNGNRPPFTYGGEVNSSGGYRTAIENLNPWFVDLDADGKAEMLVPAAPDLNASHRRYTYVVYRHGPTGPRLLGFQDMPGAPSAVLPGFGPVPLPLPVLTPPLYLPNLLLSPIDRRGDGRPVLAILRDNVALYPAAAPGNQHERWRCTIDRCNRGQTRETVDCDGKPTLPIECDGEVVEHQVFCDQLAPDCTSCRETRCSCTARRCEDAPIARSVTFAWDHRGATGGVLANPPTDTFVVPDLRNAVVAADDPEGDGTQVLGEISADVPRVDINGDGIVDAERLRTGGPGGWQAGPDLLPRGRNLRAMDYDGDGVTDLLGVAPDQNDDRMVVYRWTNEGVQKTAIPVPAGHFANPPEVLTAQYRCDSDHANHDVLVNETPVCGLYPDRTFCRRLDGVGRVDAELLGPNGPTGETVRTHVWDCEPTGVLRVDRKPGREYRTTQVLDWNGDGLMDIVTVDRGRRLVVYARRGKRADVLTAVEDGYHSRTDVEYSPVADPQVSEVDGSRVYRPGTLGCQYPLRCLQSGLWVVRRVVRDSGTPLPAIFVHSYADGRIDLRGRRPLGFRFHTVSRKVDLPTPERPSGPTRFTETVTTEKGESFTEDRGAFPLAGVVTSIRTSVVASGLVAGTWKTIAPEIIRGVGGTGSGSHPAEYSIGQSSVHVIDDAVNPLVHFVHALRVTEREFEGTADVFAETSEKRRVVTEVWRDHYGNATREQTWVHASSARGTPVPEDHSFHRMVRHFFEGDDRAPGAPFDEARFLRFPGRTTTAETLNGTMGPVRTVGYSCNVEMATIDTVTVEPDGSADVRKATTTIRTERGLPAEVTVAGSDAGRVTRTSYDDIEGMYPVKTTNPAGHITLSVFVPGLDRIAWTRDSNGRVTRMRYDGFGRIRVADGPLDADVNTSYVLSDEGLPRAITSTPAGERSVTDHDRLGREIRREQKGFDGNPVEERIEHDPFGRVRRVIRPYGESTFVYDELGRLTHELRRDPALPADAPLRPWQETRYDDHFRTTTFDAGRRESYAVTDGLGQIVEKGERLADGAVTTFYEYKPFGLLGRTLHGTDAARSATVMDYDVLGRRTTLKTPDTGTTTTAYNAFGDVRSETDAEDRTTVFVTDALGRVIEERAQEGGVPVVTRYRFDDAPNGIGSVAGATRVSPDAVTTAFAYDPAFGAPRAVHLHLPADGARTELFATAQSYDRFGRPDVITYPRAGGRTGPMRVQQVYGGADGSLSEVMDVTDGRNTSFWRVDRRERLGRVESETFGNGAVSTRGYQASTGRLESIQTVGAEKIQDLSYRYYFDGNVSLRGDGSGRFERFEYDHLNRLWAWREATAQGSTAPGGWSVEWGYDVRGNLESRTVKSGMMVTDTVTQTYEGGATAPHRLDTNSLWQGQRFTYDRVGNITGHPGVGTIAYTAFNLPRRVTTSTQVVDYVYDAFGGRVQKRSTPLGVPGDTVTYVGGLYERRTAGSETIHVMHVHAEGRVIAQVTRAEPSGSEETSYIHSDRLGSTHVVQGANGALQERHQDPFGNPVRIDGSRLDPTLSASPPGAATPSAVTRGFTGHEEETDLGLVNMIGRTYDPRLGRFLQPDPLVQAPFFSQSYNRYAYVFNNPVGMTDPTGFAGNWEDPDSGKKYEWDEEVTVTYSLAELQAMLEEECFMLGMSCAGIPDARRPRNDPPVVVDTRDGWEYGDGAAGDDGFGRAFAQELFRIQNWVPGGSFLDAVDDAKNGKWGWAAFNLGLVALDIATLGGAKFLGVAVKAVLRAEARAGYKAALNARRTIVESADAARKGDALTGRSKEGYEEIKDLLSQGRPGKHQHSLTGDLQGKSAADLPGSGRGRGAQRVIFDESSNEVVIHDIVDYHRK